MNPKIIDMKEIKMFSASVIAHLKIKSKNTFASYPWANDRAHNLRYDAVLEIDPKTNSIVSIS